MSDIQSVIALLTGACVGYAACRTRYAKIIADQRRTIDDAIEVNRDLLACVRQKNGGMKND